MPFGHGPSLYSVYRGSLSTKFKAAPFEAVKAGEKNPSSSKVKREESKNYQIHWKELFCDSFSLMGDVNFSLFL